MEKEFSHDGGEGEFGGFAASTQLLLEGFARASPSDEARANLADALRMVLECNRKIACRDEPASAIREAFELAAL